MKTTTSEPTLAALVALDWADQKRDIALQPAGATTPECFQLEHRPEVLAGWIAQLRERFGGAKVAVALEQKRGALIHALMGHEFLILCRRAIAARRRIAVRVKVSPRQSGAATVLQTFFRSILYSIPRARTARCDSCDFSPPLPACRWQ